MDPVKVIHSLQNPSTVLKLMSLKTVYTKGFEIRGLAGSDMGDEASSSGDQTWGLLGLPPSPSWRSRCSAHSSGGGVS